MGRSPNARSWAVDCLLLLVRDHLLNVGDVLLDECDLVWPGLMVRIGVWLSSSISSFCFGESGHQVFQFLFKRGAGHMRKGITLAGLRACRFGRHGHGGVVIEAAPTVVFGFGDVR